MRIMTFSNVCNRYNTGVLTVEHITIPVSIDTHALVANSVLVGKNTDTKYLQQSFLA